MIPIDGDLLRSVAPRFSGDKAVAQARIIAAIEPVATAILVRYEIATRLRIAHFLAQITHESAGLRTTEEFASGAAYEGRSDLGNTEPGDGKRFKGRGLLQLTGRANYKSFGKKLDIDLISNPGTAADPEISLLIACEYWKDRKINPDCDRDDLITVTKKINGGTKGLDDRRAYLVKAKAALARLEAIAVAGSDPAAIASVLRRGSKGEQVVSLQTALRSRGYDLAIDGDFGPATEVALMHFQKAKGLAATGIADPATWQKLV
jgi:putative chitinase